MIDLILLESIWRSLLPKEAEFSHGWIEDEYPCLTQVESDSFGAVSPIRSQELKAGRFHAKVAMNKLGVSCQDLARSESHNGPQWPENVVGSISHTNLFNSGYVISVAGLKSSINAIGIDTEFKPNIERNVMSYFMTPEEIHSLSHVNNDYQSNHVSKLWCIKESAVKAFNQPDVYEFKIKQTSSGEICVYRLSTLKDKMLGIGMACTFGDVAFASVFNNF